MKKNIFLFLIITSLLSVVFISYIVLNNQGTKADSSHKITKEEKSKDKSNLTLYEKLSEGDSLNVLIMGDSIGESIGTGDEEYFWYNILNNFIQDEYGSSIQFNQITKGGATTFDGVIDYSRTTKEHSYDLVIIMYGQNDKDSLKADEFKYLYNGLIHNIKSDHPDTEIYTVIQNSIKEGEYVEDEITHITEQRGYQLIDVREAFQDVGELTTDSIHPNNEGYQVYAEEIMKVLRENVANGKDINLENIESPFNDVYSLSYNTVEGFSNSEGMFVSDEKGSYITATFAGNSVGFSVSGTDSSGTAEVFINDKYHGEYNLFAPDGREKHLFVTDDLKEGDNEIRIMVTGSPGINFQGNETDGTFVNLTGIHVLN